MNSFFFNSEVPVKDIIPVKLSILLASKEEEMSEYITTIKLNFIDAAFKEIGDGVTICNTPSKEECIEASTSNCLIWDPIDGLRRSQLNLK